MANLVPTKGPAAMPKIVFKRNRDVAPEQLVKALTDVMQAPPPRVRV